MSDIKKIKELINKEIEIEETCIAGEKLAGNVVKESQYRGVKAGLEVALNIINDNSGEIESELSRLREENGQLKHKFDNVPELLALMCGSEYVEKHGTHNTINQAIYKFNELREENERLKSLLKCDVDGCEEMPNSHRCDNHICWECK